MKSPAETTTRSPARSLELGTCSIWPSLMMRWAMVSARALRGVSALGLAAPLRHGFGEVGEQHGEPRPQGDLQVEAERRAAAEQQHPW